MAIFIVLIHIIRNIVASIINIIESMINIVVSMINIAVSIVNIVVSVTFPAATVVAGTLPLRAAFVTTGSSGPV